VAAISTILSEKYQLYRESNSYLIEEYLEGESNKTIVFVGFSDLLRYVCCIPKFRIHAPTLL
jgi:hypothetical protein